MPPVGALRRIGVEASEFLGVQGIFAQIFPNLAKKLSCKFCRPFFGVTYKKWSLLVFLQILRAICKVKQCWAPFLPIFSGILSRYLVILFGFSGILPKFSEICPNFQQIKTFGGALAPLHPRLLHQCSDVPACCYQLSLSRYITCQDVCDQEPHATKRLISELEAKICCHVIITR